MLHAGAAGTALALLRVRPAFATPETLAAALKETFGEHPRQQGKVSIDMPQIAENGNVVPVTVSVESPMSVANYVKSIHLFSEKNPLPRVVEFHLGPHNGVAKVSTRIRLADSQNVLAVATLSDETLWTGSVFVEVSISGCG